MFIQRHLLPFAAVLLSATPLFAQDQSTPPAPKSGSWITLLIALVVIIVVLIASFMSAKRGHQD